MAKASSLTMSSSTAAAERVLCERKQLTDHMRRRSYVAVCTHENE